MNSRKSTWLGLTVAALVAMPALAAANDLWLTTKAKIALLTTDGVSIRSVKVDSVDGAVTLHGKVRTDAEKQKAAFAVGNVDGVKSVRNLLQVVPGAFSGAVQASDETIKEGVEATLKIDKSVEGIKVASVNNGVVLLSGRAPSLAGKLRAIELALSVTGVSRVASEIEPANN